MGSVVFSRVAVLVLGFSFRKSWGRDKYCKFPVVFFLQLKFLLIYSFNFNNIFVNNYVAHIAILLKLNVANIKHKFNKSDNVMSTLCSFPKKNSRLCLCAKIKRFVLGHGFINECVCRFSVTECENFACLHTEPHHLKVRFSLPP